MNWAKENIKKALGAAVVVGAAVVAFINEVMPFLKSLLGMLN